MLLLTLASLIFPAPTQQPPILDYIHNGWDTLNRSVLQCGALRDPKIQSQPMLYLPAELPTPPLVAALQHPSKPPATRKPLAHLRQCIVEGHRLFAASYTGDRAMRESRSTTGLLRQN